jgi:transcription elongation GreA/GreB family factor
VIKKESLLKEIVRSLAESVEALGKAARASHAEATHESSKAENKYDTRGLEAAYLAGGQARQVKEILEAIAIYQGLKLRNFELTDPAELTALVELKADKTRSLYFLGPKSGGLEVVLGGHEIMVITPHSPLGQQIMGKRAGDRWTAKLGGTLCKYEVTSVA